MKPKRRRVGTGITERDVIDPDWFLAEDDLEQMEERVLWALSIGSSDWIVKWRERASSILRTHGLPSTFGHYRQDEHGYWIEDEGLRARFIAFRRFLADPDQTDYPGNLFGENYQALPDIAESNFGTDSIPHFMARILQQIWSLELCRELDDRDGAELASFGIGQLVTQLTMKLKWERSALTGQKTNTHLAEARHRGADVRKAKAREWREPAREHAASIWKERPNSSVSEVSRHVRKRLKEGNYPMLPSSDRALQDAIRNLAPKKNGSDN